MDSFLRIEILSTSVSEAIAGMDGVQSTLVGKDFIPKLLLGQPPEICNALW